MSSVCRSIRRNIAKRNGTFIAQKPLRNKSNVSFKDSIISAYESTARVATVKNKHLTFSEYIMNIFGKKNKEAK